MSAPALAAALAYHADDEIARTWLVSGLVGAAIVAALALVLSRTLPSGPGGGSAAPVAAIAVALLTGRRRARRGCTS